MTKILIGAANAAPLMARTAVLLPAIGFRHRVESGPAVFEVPKHPKAPPPEPDDSVPLLLKVSWVLLPPQLMTETIGWPQSQ